ncbi:MAG: hypothetical protein A3G40_09375 [Deltaproteobacteria bacterium RIFCSPLOWO2_12_FULL_57_22]|nr:MAG: hypothetical protein A3G40_09375 [Deltaproteobacteria bacterium RIFCSPLOWO2_12_FULL_57_22]
MVKREVVADWLKRALASLGGRATIAQVMDEIYKKHGREIDGTGDFEKKWTYEVRWAADMLRKAGIMKPASDSPRGIWELDEPI